MGTRVWVPAHLTGFFEICDSYPDPLRRGSRGAGVNLALGIETEVAYDPGQGGVSVEINGRPRPDAVVSLDAGRQLLQLSRVGGGLRIRHSIPVPIGSGFGTSGAAALGVLMGGARELGLSLGPIEAAQLAHCLELKHGTGLGTVAAEFYGGLEVRDVPGAPGVGRVVRIPLTKPMSVVAVHNGPLCTPRLLADPHVRRRVNEVGRRMTERLLDEFTVESFLRLSHEFALGLKLAPRRVDGALRRAAEEGLYVGMAMFGRTYFTLVDEADVEWAMGLMRRLLPQGRVIVTRASPEGARLN